MKLLAVDKKEHPQAKAAEKGGSGHFWRSVLLYGATAGILLTCSAPGVSRTTVKKHSRQLSHAIIIKKGLSTSDLIDVVNGNSSEKEKIDAIYEILDRNATGRVSDLTRVARSDSNRNVRLHAVGAIGQLGNSSTISVLLAIIQNDRDENVRSQAAWGAMNLGGKRALRQIEEIFQNGNSPELCEPVIKFIGEYNDTRALPLLMGIIDDTSYRSDIKIQAFNAIGALNSTEARRVLPNALIETLKHVKKATDLDELAGIARQKGIADAVPVLIELLHSSPPNAEIRNSAVVSLAMFEDPRSVPVLIEVAQKDSSIDVRRIAITCLGNLKDPSGGPALVGILKTLDYQSDYYLLNCVFNALVNADKNDPTFVPALIEVAQNDSPIYARYTAISILGQLKDPRIGPALVGILKTLDLRFDESLPKCVKDALVSICNNDPRFVPAFINVAQKDSSKYVRISAISCFGKLNDTRIVPALIEVAQNDPSMDVRSSALGALDILYSRRYSHDSRIAPALIKIALKDSSEDIRRHAIFVLEKRNGHLFVPDFIESAKNDSSIVVRNNAISDFLDMNDYRIMSALIELAQKEPSDDIRWHAVEVLGNYPLSDKYAVNVLQAMASGVHADKSPEVREMAERAARMVSERLQNQNR